MIKLPLKRAILLFVDGKTYLCRVIHAGPDVVTCVDCYERVITPEGVVFYVEEGLHGKVRYDRSKISGYKLIEDSELDNIYQEDREENEKLVREYMKKIAEDKRRNLKIIRNPTFEDELRKSSGKVIQLKFFKSGGSS